MAIADVGGQLGGSAWLTYIVLRLDVFRRLNGCNRLRRSFLIKYRNWENLWFRPAQMSSFKTAESANKKQGLEAPHEKIYR